MRQVLLLGLLVGVVACAARPSPHLIEPGAALPSAISALAARSPLAAGQNIGATELRRSVHSSVHLVQVRDREQPHVHTRYDLVVLMADGAGTLWLDGHPRPMRAGDAAYIPVGTPHYFVNEGRDPAVAVVVFSPPFDGPDQRPVP
jgi:mannose-6-phosphate isomerase-like protein (cupin superfamily)